MSTVEVGGAERVDGEVSVPGDKSISHRALILGALIRGRSYVGNLSPAADVAATAAALQACGGSVRAFGDGRVSLDGAGPGVSLHTPAGPLDCANSGTTMRLLSGVLGAHDLTAVLDGDASLRRRPMERVAAPLRAMGATVATDEGHAPITIRGTSRPAGVEHTLQVASAQVKSAILLAGLAADGATVVREPLPSRDHTERLLRACGADLSANGASVTLRPAPLGPFGLRVPGDMSSAAFFLALAASRTGWRVRCTAVGLNPGRTGILEVLEAMGARVDVEEGAMAAGVEPQGTVTVAGAALHGVTIAPDIVPRCIDELPVIALLASQAEGRTELRGAAELRAKESDRITSIAAGLRLMGVPVEELPDGLVVEGPVRLRPARLDAGGDHRLAMTWAVAASLVDPAARPCVIDGAECVAVSYPGFFADLGVLTNGPR